MIFTSFNFLFFLPAVIVIFYLCPRKFRWPFLLIASYYFYISLSPVYALILAFITLITYTFTVLIDITKSAENRKMLFLFGIVITLLPLFFFKYYDFINNSIFALLQYFHIRWPLPSYSLLLPVGISFYTFMALGYIIDVYNEEIKAERNIGIVALFLSFFPLVLSGPIERATNMFNQFKNIPEPDYDKIIKGLQLMLWGYFMKLVIADRVALYTDAVFNNIEYHSGITLIFAALLYPIQVYGDLGGYSLIAIGCASVLGIFVIPNFNRPFFATSMSEFWRRWHMSLIKWLTDYIYTPLSFGLRKHKIWGIVIALMLTFMLSGIWHGASITFIIWGAFQGVVLSFEALTNRKKIYIENKLHLSHKKWYIVIGCMLTYIIFSFSLLFAGAVDSVSEAFLVIKKMFTDSNNIFIDKTTLVYSFIGIVFLLLSELRDEYFPHKYQLFSNNSIVIRWGAYFAIFFIIILIGVFNGGQFIYFQF